MLYNQKHYSSATWFCHWNTTGQSGCAGTCSLWKQDVSKPESWQPITLLPYWIFSLFTIVTSKSLWAKCNIQPNWSPFLLPAFSFLKFVVFPHFFTHLLVFVWKLKHFISYVFLVMDSSLSFFFLLRTVGFSFFWADHWTESNMCNLLTHSDQ